MGHLNEGLLVPLGDGRCCARLERAGRDGVDRDSVLAAGLIGEHARVALERSLGGRPEK